MCNRAVQRMTISSTPCLPACPVSCIMRFCSKHSNTHPLRIGLVPFTAAFGQLLEPFSRCLLVSCDMRCTTPVIFVRRSLSFDRAGRSIPGSHSFFSGLTITSPLPSPCDVEVLCKQQPKEAVCPHTTEQIFTVALIGNSNDRNRTVVALAPSQPSSPRLAAEYTTPQLPPCPA